MWRPTYHQVIAQLADAFTTLLSFVAAYYLWVLLRWSAPGRALGAEIFLDRAYVAIMTAAAAIWVIIFHYFGVYSYQRFTSFITEFKIICKTVILGSMLLIGMIFLFRPGYVSRTLVILFVMANLGLLTLEKLLLFCLAGFIRKRGKNRKVVLVVGTGDQTKRFVETIQKHFLWGLDIVGFLDPYGENVGKVIFGKKILGSFNDILPVLHSHHLDEVIITVSTRRMGEIRSVLEACEQEGVRVRIISNFLGKIGKRIRADHIFKLPVISISYIPDHQLPLLIKRGMDIGVVSILLVLLAPVFLLIALGIKLTSSGPVFYQWNVVGFNKKPFRSWKFRTMVVGADDMKKDLLPQNEMNGPVFKIKKDPRVTSIGRFLRKFSLDELPQLWSVLKGDMSLVGPRPAGPHELIRYESWQRRKLSFKPGITCLWQVNGRNEIHDFDDWVKMDLEYIDNWSLGLDIKILLKTIPAVILGKGAS
jgi:exopolysaccharide biosynthesis polyprenyl glycosylphosphotransferase